MSSEGFCEMRQIRHWLCYYGSTFGERHYSKFDLVVLDSFSHPPLAKNRQGHPIVLGYLSIGEVDVEGPFWHLSEGKPFLVKKNKSWDSWLIDVRDPSWKDLLFQTAIPSILTQGFDGLFLDTMDSCLFLEEDNEKFEGTETALMEIVKKIDTDYPEKLICVNRALPLLPAIASNIDYVAIEDLYSYYAGEEQGYLKVDPETQTTLLNQAKKGILVNPELTVLTLDYAPFGQTALAKEAIFFSRKNGFIPYVSTYKLNHIFFYTLDH